MAKKNTKIMSGTVKAGSKTPISPLKPLAELKGTKVGIVDSDKRDKTRRVVMTFQSMHPKYGKYISNRTILHVHDERNESRTGDVVEIAQCRPVSKTKQWRLVRVVEKRGELTAAIQSAKEVQ